MSDNGHTGESRQRLKLYSLLVSARPPSGVTGLEAVGVQGPGGEQTSGKTLDQPISQMLGLSMAPKIGVSNCCP